MPLDIQLGDVVETRKPHPCGGTRFEIVRTGMDFRMVCLTCRKEIWVTRPKLEKRIKKHFRGGEPVSR